LTISEAQV
jgi:rhamnogalacturonan endolyase